MKRKERKQEKNVVGGAHILAVLWNYLLEPYSTNCLLQQTDSLLEK